MTPTMPTKMQQKSHNLWGNVAEIPKKKPKSMDLLGVFFSCVIYKVRSIPNFFRASRV